MAQTVKRLPAMWETRVQFLGREDPLEKEMAIHSSTVAWKNPMDRGAWKATVHGVAKSRTRLSDFTFFHLDLWKSYEYITESSCLSQNFP